MTTSESETIYAIAYNRRVYLEWCYEEGVDPASMVYVPDGRWLRKHGTLGLCYRLATRYQDRRDWVEIRDVLVALSAMEVAPYVHKTGKTIYLTVGEVSQLARMKHLFTRLGETARSVLEFHLKYELPVRGTPDASVETVSNGLAGLRIGLHYEERDELITAIEERDVVKIADALADLVYVAYGTALTYGIDLDEVLREVHRSNMTKDRPAVPGGKAVKGEAYTPPDVAGVLTRQEPLPLSPPASGC